MKTKCETPVKGVARTLEVVGHDFVADKIYNSGRIIVHLLFIFWLNNVKQLNAVKAERKSVYGASRYDICHGKI